MSTFSQFSGGSQPIGTQHEFPNSNSGGYNAFAGNPSTVELTDGSVWLKSGTIAAASDFPRLAAHKHYGFVGKLDELLKTNLPGNILLNEAAKKAVCYDETRNILLIPEVISNVFTGRLLRSTDRGVSFTPILLPGYVNGQMQIHSIATNGTNRFVALVQVGAWASASLFAYYSTDGTTWTQGANLGGDPYYVYNYVPAQIVWAGTQFVYAVVLKSSTVYYVLTYTTVDGISIANGTNSSFSSQYSSQQLHLSSNGNNVVLCFSNYQGQQSTTYYAKVSTNSGTSWTANKQIAANSSYSMSDIQTAIIGANIVVSVGSYAIINGAGASRPTTWIPISTFTTSDWANVNFSANQQQFARPGKFIKIFNKDYIFGGYSISELSASGTEIVANTNIISNNLIALDNRLLAIENSTGLYNITDDITRIDSCGFLGSTIATGQYTSILASTYVKAK